MHLADPGKVIRCKLTMISCADLRTSRNHLPHRSKHKKSSAATFIVKTHLSSQKWARTLPAPLNFDITRTPLPPMPSPGQPDTIPYHAYTTHTPSYTTHQIGFPPESLSSAHLARLPGSPLYPCFHMENPNNRNTFKINKHQAPRRKDKSAFPAPQNKKTGKKRRRLPFMAHQDNQVVQTLNSRQV